MLRNRFALVAPLGASLLLAGCGRTTPMVVGPDHPASPEATVAPAPAPSQTLAVTTTAGVPSQAAGAADGMQDHSSHGAPGGAAAMPTAEPAPGRAPEMQPAASGAYVCPMHPEVTSDDREARCPKCNMRLVAKEGGQ